MTCVCGHPIEQHMHIALYGNPERIGACTRTLECNCQVYRVGPRLPSRPTEDGQS